MSSAQKLQTILTTQPWVPWAGALFVGTLVALALYPALKTLINGVANLHLEAKAVKNAIGQRQPAGQLRVRQTDLVERMSRVDRGIYREAEQLLAAGNVLQAAQRFEAIKFQRRAIDELEKAKMIDEAAAVLLRMNVPFRAGVLYERNGMPQHAAHLFERAGKPADAARVLLVMAQKDPRYFVRAADLFVAGGNPMEAGRIYAMMLATEQVVTQAVAASRFDALLEYMGDPVSAREVTAILDEPKVHDMLRALSDSPRTGRLLAAWASVEPSDMRRTAIEERSRRQPAVAKAFQDARKAIVPAAAATLVPAREPDLVKVS